MDLAKFISKRIDFSEYLEDVYDVELDRGRCACPVHGGSNKTSFRIKGEYGTCYSCGFYGDIVNFVAEKECISYYAALEMLAKKANISISDKEEYVRKKDTIESNERKADAAAKKIDQYINYLKEDRNLSEETIKAFNFGGSKDGIIIPLRNCHGQTVAFAQRNMSHEAKGKPKYINSKNSEVYEKSEFLFNLDKALPLMRQQKQVYICEGYFDVASFHDQGYPAVGYCSSDITVGQIKLLYSKIKDLLPDFTILLCPDNDEAGQKKIPRARDKFVQHIPNATVRIVKIPDNRKDFSDCHVLDIKAKDLETFPIDLFMMKSLVEANENIDTQFNVAWEFFHTIPNKIVKSECIIYLAQLWERDIDLVAKMLESEVTNNNLIEKFKTAETALDELYEMYTMGKLGSGFPTIDASSNSFYKTEVLIWAARPAGMKTFMSCSQSLHLSIREKKNGLFFSLEMSAGSLYSRMIAMFLGKSSLEIEKMIIEKDPTVLKIQDALEKRLFVIDDNEAINEMDKMSKLIDFANQRIFTEGKVDYIIIDYIQFIKNSSDYTKFSEEVKKLKQLAKQHKILVIVLSQVGRGIEEWVAPTADKMKGAGDIEQTGDVIISLHRPETNPKLTLDEKEEAKGSLVATFLKHRRGFRKTEVFLRFDENTSRIEEINA